MGSSPAKKAGEGLTPLENLGLENIDTFSGLVKSMKETALSGRQLGEALEIVLEMVQDDSCLVVLTVAGPMTVAKLGSSLAAMIDRGLVGAVVTTGAVLTHGLVESIGLAHYRCDPLLADDVSLNSSGYNRIYDTLEKESNLDEIERFVVRVLDDVQLDEGIWSSVQLCRALGARLTEASIQGDILGSAYEQNVPVFVPAFTDSEIGLDVSIWAMLQDAKRERSEVPSMVHDPIFRIVPSFNPFLDLQEYARLVSEAKHLGILTIGGGVPRNWAQQVAPYLGVLYRRLGLDSEPPRFRYGVRICPEPVHWGGLSGCTYKEGISWGKFVPPSEGGRYAEVLADASLVWPLLMKAVFEELDELRGT